MPGHDDARARRRRTDRSPRRAGSTGGAGGARRLARGPVHRVRGRRGQRQVHPVGPAGGRLGARPHPGARRHDRRDRPARLLLDARTTGLDDRAEALLMAADRAQHVAEVVRPALGAGRHVVSDRYIGSSLAYQGHGRGLPVAELRRLSDWAADGLWPDLVVLLDVPRDGGGGPRGGTARPHGGGGRPLPRPGGPRLPGPGQRGRRPLGRPSTARPRPRRSRRPSGPRSPPASRTWRHRRSPARPFHPVTRPTAPTATRRTRRPCGDARLAP